MFSVFKVFESIPIQAKKLIDKDFFDVNEVSSWTSILPYFEGKNEPRMP